jgi:hypothetical protein
MEHIGDGVDVTTVGSPVQASGKRDSLILVQPSTMAPFTNPPLNLVLHLLSLNLYSLQCTSRSPLLRSGSHPSPRSDLSKATTASTKTFLTALVLNSVIAGVEISTFTLVRRYFRLIYEPRSLSVFES